MATINLGRIGFVNKGDYNALTAYKVNDIVKYTSGTYACKLAHTGQVPTETAYWQEWVDDNAVHKTGDETIAGSKAFSSPVKLANSGFNTTLQSGTLSGDVVHTLPEVSDTLAGISNVTGLKNHIINGNFGVWQRGESISGISSSTAYRADRWFFRTSTSGATDLVTSKKYSANYGNYLEYTYTGSTSGHYFRQSIENPTIFHKKTMTYSIDVINCSVVANFDLILVINNGTADIYIQVLKPEFFTTHTDVRPEGVRYSFTFEVPDLTSYNLSSPNSWLAVYPTTNWTGTGTFRFGRVQLEEGSVATPFEQRPYGLELSLCQRYYQRHFYAGITSCVLMSAISSTVARGCMTLPVEMRTVPTRSITGNLSQDWTLGALTSNTISSIVVNTGYPGHIFIDATTTGLTVGQASPLRRNNVSGTNPALILDAEL